MRQLSAQDASFLYAENRNQPMHIGGVWFCDQSTSPGNIVRFKRIIQLFKERAHLAPYMRERLAFVPANLDYPYWVKDENFDPEYHVRHLALPKPGDWRQLCILTARLNSQPLDLNYPLWQMYVIEGLDNVEGIPPNCFALLSKTHHAAIDGRGGTEATMALTDLTPEIEEKPSSEPWIPDIFPSDLELLARAYFSNLHRPLRHLEVLSKTVPILSKVTTEWLGGERPGLIHKIPITRFNRNVTGHRIFDAVFFQLNDLKSIKNSVPGATINDVVLTICGGALRKYLIEKSELPKDSLVAMCPINIRVQAPDKTFGNEVSAMNIPIRTDIEDAKTRLMAIHDGTRNAKQLTQAIGAKTMTDLTKYVPSALAAWGARVATEEALKNLQRNTPTFNTVITNVPGPQVPVYFCGARVTRMLGFAPVSNGGTGLTHVVGSYDGELVISISSCREIMPDPSKYVQYLRESFQELMDTTAARPEGTSGKTVRTITTVKPQSSKIKMKSVKKDIKKQQTKTKVLSNK